MQNRKYPSHPQVAVGAIVFKKGQILLVRRRNPPAEGIWAIPGGKVRLGETLQQAAEREILEETGIVIRASAPVFTFDMIDRDRWGRPRFHYVITDLEAIYVSGQVLPGDDALSAKWVSEKTMATLNVSQITRHLLFEHFGFGQLPDSLPDTPPAPITKRLTKRLSILPE